jgi:hypothetical protein
MATKKIVIPEIPEVVIMEWKVVGAQENFTVLGLATDNKIYFWKDGKWNLL